MHHALNAGQQPAGRQECLESQQPLSDANFSSVLMQEATTSVPTTLACLQDQSNSARMAPSFPQVSAGHAGRKGSRHAPVSWGPPLPMPAHSPSKNCRPPRLLHAKPTPRSMCRTRRTTTALVHMPDRQLHHKHGHSTGISITSYAGFAMACTALDCCLLREVHPAGAQCLGTGVATSL